MSEITNTATIRVVADASGVEAGLRQVTEGARRAGRAVTEVGNGAAGSTRAIETAQRSIIASIQRTTTAMEAGGRSTAAYYELLARQKGVDPNILAPYISALKAVEEAQARAAQTMAAQQVAQQQAAETARAQAAAQRDLAQAQANRDNFLGSLREQVALFGASTEEVQRYRAAQLGAARDAEPLIAQLHALRVAQEQAAVAAQSMERAQREASQVNVSRDAFLASLREEIALFGRSAEEVRLYRASQVDAAGAAAPLITQLRSLREAEEQAAAAARAMEQAQREATQINTSRDTFLSGLREQIALYGRSAEEVMQYRAAQLGAAGAAGSLITQLRSLREAQEQVNQTQKAQAGRDSFVADLRQQTEAIGRTRTELLELRAAQLGVTNQAAPFIAQLRAAEQGLQNGQMSAAAMNAALRQVPAQMTDIIVSLQGGQAPLTVLLQQGGQLRDMFGSVGGAMKALGGAVLNLINPYTVAIAAVAGLTYAYKVGHDESIEYARALALTNNIAGVTSGQMGDMAREIGAVAGSQHSAAAALAELAATGAIAGSNLQRFGLVSVEAQRVLGKEIKDTAGEFAELGKSPLSALQSIGDKYHFITAETFAAVKAAQEQGRSLEAVNIAQNAYADGISKQRQAVLDSLSDWERGWLRIKTATGGALDALIDFASGREKGNAEKINDLLSDRDKIQGSLNRSKARGLNADVAAYQAQLDANEREINSIRGKDAAKRKAAEAEAAQVRADELRNKWLGESNVLLTRQQELQRDLGAARTEGVANGLSEEEIQSRLTVVRRKYNDVYVQGVDTSITALRRRAEIEDERDKRALAMIESQRSLGTISDDDAINRTATVELEALDRQKKLTQDQLNLIRSKLNSQREQADLEGQIAVLGEQRRSREQQQKNELLALDVQRYRAAVEHSANAIEKEMDERNSLQQLVMAQHDYNDQIGLSEKQIAARTAALLREGAARKDIEADIAEGFDLTGERAARIREEAAALRERAAAIVEGADKSERYSQWKSAVDQYGQIFQEGFADMLNGGSTGWSSFSRSLVTTFKTTVADQIYKMFARPIVVQLVGSYLGVSPTAIAGEISNQPNGYGITPQSAGGSAGLISAAQTASSLYKAISGGFDSLSGSVADAVQAGLYKTGLSSNIASNGAFANGVGSAASMVGGYMAGSALNSAISGKYETGSGFMKTEKIATAVASYFSPIAGAIVGGVSGLINRAFGMGPKETQTTGLSGSISAGGLTASSYAKWHEDGGWFRSDKNGTDSKSLSTDALAVIANGLSQIKAVSSSFATSIGADANLIASYSKSFNIDLGKDGKIEDGVTKLLSSVGDELAARLVPNIAQFTKSGETASSTLERLASDFTATTQMAQLLGKTAAEAFGSAGIASAATRERLVDLAGSASNLTSWASSYAQNYLTEQEKLAPVKKAVDEAMSSLGLASVTTRDEFKRVVASLDLTTEAGAKQFTSMMQLADAFAQVHAATETLTRSESDIASERASLQDQLDQLTMTSTQLLKKQRDALAEANRPLFDMVQTAQKLADTSSSLKSFRDSVRSLSDSLSTGSLSVLTPEQQEVELKSQYEKIRAAAMGGDTTAQGKFSDALTAWLTASQKLNAGDTTYQADFAQGQKDASAAASWATGQIDSAQAQLSEMNSQTLALKGMQNTLDAANKILDTIAQNTGPAPIQSGFVLSNAISVMGTVLGTAIKAVQSEVASLRKDQDAQTGNTIAANAEGQQAIVDSVKKSASKTANTVEKVTLE